MAYKIYLRDGGLNTSPTIPPGYTALGSDSGDIKKKVVDTVSDVGGGGSGSYFKYVTTFYTVGDGDTVSILYPDIVSGGVIPDATAFGGTASDDPYIDFNVQVYLPNYTPIGGIGDGIIQTSWFPIPLNTTLNNISFSGSVNMTIDMSGNISLSFDFGDTGVPIPIRVVITA
jgi:hypothetical protein